MTKAERAAERRRTKMTYAAHQEMLDVTAFIAIVRADAGLQPDDWLDTAMPNGKRLRDCTFGEIQALVDQREAEADARLSDDEED
jgi:hypothetical protein